MSRQADRAQTKDAHDTELEARIARVGGRLASCLGEVLSAIPGAPHGPADLARRMSIDKVLARIRGRGVKV